jgi:hypothetical protein
MSKNGKNIECILGQRYSSNKSKMHYRFINLQWVSLSSIDSKSAFLGL